MSDAAIDKLPNEVKSYEDLMKTQKSNEELLTMPSFLTPELITPKLPAELMYERLGKYISNFEKNLNDEQEIGARLVSFGQTVTFHIQKIGHSGSDLIDFDGITDDGGNRVKLIQHISQLSVLLIAMNKTSAEPVRLTKPNGMGFIWD